jgi:hypothetical protein
VIKKTILACIAQVCLMSYAHTQDAPLINGNQEKEVTSLTFSDRVLSYLKNVGFGIGGLTTSPFTSVKNQNQRNIIDPNLSFYLTGKWNIKNQLYFAPEFTYVLFPNYRNEYSKNITIYSLIFMSNVWKDLYLRFGLSTFITTIWGEPGTIQVNDGGAMSTYYLPGDVGKSYNTALTLGSEYLIKEHVAVRVDTFLLSAWSKTARQISYSTSLHYYF